MPRKYYTSFLEFHKDCKKTGLLQKGSVSYNGMCWSFEGERANILQLFEPTEKQEHEMEDKGLDIAYWASGLKKTDPNIDSKYTHLRETIILFCAAMNDEL